MALLYGDGWEHKLAHTRIFVLAWDGRSHLDCWTQERLALAQRLKKPIRILVLGAARLPEHLCAGYDDFVVAHVQSLDEGEYICQQWLAEIRKKETAP